MNTKAIRRNNMANNIGMSILCIFLCVLFYIRDIREIDIGKLITVAPFIFSFFVMSKDNFFNLIALTLPLTWGVSTGFIFPIVIFLLIFKYKEKGLPFLIFSVLLLLFEIIHYYFYGDFNKRFDLGMLLSLFCMIFFVSYFLYNNKDFNKDKFVLFFCVGSAIFLTMVILHSMKIYGIYGVLSGAYRIGDEGIVSELENTDLVYFRANANNMAFYSASCISFLVILLKRKSINVILALLMFLIFVFAGLVSQSRTWVITIALFSFMFFILNNKHSVREIAVVLVLLLSFTYILLSLQDISGALSERFSSSSTETAGSRTVIFSEYNKYLHNNLDALLWGIGVSSQNLIAKVNTGKVIGYHSPHNAIQQIVVSYGIIGVICILVPFFRQIMKNYHKCRGSFYYLLPLLVVIFFLQTLQLFYPSQLMAPIIPAVCIVSMTQTLKNQ